MRVPTITVAFAVLLAAAGVEAQNASTGDKSLSGVWMPATETRGYTMSQWFAGDLPFTPAGRAAFDANVPGKGPRQTLPARGNDPIGTANPPGLYRTLVYPRPWEFVQLEDRVLQFFEWGKHWRTIWTDGRPAPEEIVQGPFWYGYSVGEWQGDTLVVKTVSIDGRQWLDEWGTPISEYEAKIEERWKRTSDAEIELTITVNDPEIYARPWASTVRKYALQPKGSVNGEPFEQLFAPIDEAVFNERVRDPSAAGPNKVD